jgi:hypothetical protein
VKRCIRFKHACDLCLDRKYGVSAKFLEPVTLLCANANFLEYKLLLNPSFVKNFG